jgi:hypothetical protein
VSELLARLVLKAEADNCYRSERHDDGLCMCERTRQAWRAIVVAAKAIVNPAEPEP